MTEIDHQSRAHARMSASKIFRIQACPGSLAAEAQFPDTSGEAAIRGTKIHELSEHLLQGIDIEGEQDPELLAEAIQYVDELRERTGHIKRYWIEMNFDEELQQIHPDLGGTADYVGTGGGELLVVDLKTGRNQVDVKDNTQLLTYALGAALKLNAPRDVKVRMAIYQQGWREYTIDMATLMDWREELLLVANRASVANAMRIPGADQCQYCKARTTCPELRAAAISAAQEEFAPGQAVEASTIHEAKMCMVWAEAVLDNARAQLENDANAIPGWTLKPGRKMVAWKDRAMAEALLKDRADAWELKSASAIQKLGVELPAGVIEEKRAAPSLVQQK
jgi:Protein of unknown function (DUF2800)